MRIPKKPTNELRRLAALSQYKLLDSLPEVDYDNITKLVSTICEVPISLITILDADRNFFKSHHGFPASESPRDISFCGHAILEKKDIFIVKDARLDERFVGNPLVEDHKAIFYAGVPLISDEGYTLGTLCVFDHEPRELTENQIESLIILGKQVVNLFELRRKNFSLLARKKDLVNRNVELNNFASHVSHDLKSPLANIISLTGLLKEDSLNNLSPDSKQYLAYIGESATILKNYIDGILFYYKADELVKAKNENVKLSVLYQDLKQALMTTTDALHYEDLGIVIDVNRPALTQILINLVDNALKCNESDQRIVHINYVDELFHHKFSVKDNGIGIPKDKQDYIFELFKTLSQDGKQNTGIGLTTVKNLVNKLGGSITLTSQLGKGSTFTFTIEK